MTQQSTQDDALQRIFDARDACFVAADLEYLAALRNYLADWLYDTNMVIHGQEVPPTTVDLIPFEAVSPFTTNQRVQPIKE